MKSYVAKTFTYTKKMAPSYNMQTAVNGKLIKFTENLYSKGKHFMCVVITRPF